MPRLAILLTWIGSVALLALGGASAPLAQAAPPWQTIGVITFPRSGDSIAGTVNITGSASHPEFWKYEVHYGIEPNPSDWVLIGTVHESPVMNGRLETWNTTLVPDGVYSLRLRVARRDGNYDEYYVRQIIVSNTRPTETPTPAETPTPSVTPTPLPPTPTIVIEQPRRTTPTPEPSPSPGVAQPTVIPTATEAPPNATAVPAAPAISVDALREALCRGSTYVVIAFVALGVLALVRKTLVAIGRWIIRRIRKQEAPDYQPWRRR